MRLTRTRVATFFLSAFFLLLGIATAGAEPLPAICGRVVDAVTHKPIEGAWVISGGDVTRTNREGRFELHKKAPWVGVRAIGYSRQQFAARPEMQVVLTRLEIRGLYLSFWGVSSQVLRNAMTLS